MGVLDELLNQMGEGVYFANLDRKILIWNKAAESISGFSKDEVLGRPCADNVLIHTDEAGINLCETSCPLRKAAEKGEKIEAEVFLRHKQGHRVPVRVRVFPAYDGEGNLVGSFELFNESSSVTETRRRMVMLEEMAYADPLTGLANRRYLQAKLETFIEEFRRHTWHFGLLLFDLDHFKQVNDRYGHDVGDLVLTSVGQTLSNASRSIDVISRWGGEEFVGLYRGVTLKGLELLAQRYRGLISSISVEYENQWIRPTVSIGGTVVGPNDTPETLFKRVDQALYEAKDAGRNCVRVFA